MEALPWAGIGNGKRKKIEWESYAYRESYSCSCIQDFRMTRSILYKEDQTYIAKEKELNEQLEDATEEQQQLADYEQYTQSQQYIEEVAKSKLGLVYNNEIVFKEQDTEDGK